MRYMDDNENIRKGIYRNTRQHGKQERQGEREKVQHAHREKVMEKGPTVRQIYNDRRAETHKEQYRVKQSAGVQRQTKGRAKRQID